MSATKEDTQKEIFFNCSRILGTKTWGRILTLCNSSAEPEGFLETLQTLDDLSLPSFITELAKIEYGMYVAEQLAPRVSYPVHQHTINPTVQLIPATHSNLAELINNGAETTVDKSDAPGGVHIIIWYDQNTHEVQVKEATDADLLALKIVSENIPAKDAASAGGVKIAHINGVIRHAVSIGLILKPPSNIRREVPAEQSENPALKKFITADTFTLQWHITQACDLHCKHCYDRSDLAILPYEKMIAVLDEFHEFCDLMQVMGQVTFTGGNPLLYPRFIEIYQETADRGLAIAILGNPTPIEEIEALVAIAKPHFFQISLEGLESHNDHIRGLGHFQRSLGFLEQLKRLNLYTMVMLTLTRENMNQVLPLAEILRDKVDSFTFNRLSMVGEGAQLAMADPDDFALFLEEYSQACQTNPILAQKDNLLNITRHNKNHDLFGGCTGYGCGAAFNFMTLLPNGEIHACRKFPSRIGSISEPFSQTPSIAEHHQNRFQTTYHSEIARKYRQASSECQQCTLNLVCRGCLAAAHSCGLDIFTSKDPFCFLPETTQNA